MSSSWCRHFWHAPFLPATTNFASRRLAKAALSKYNLCVSASVCDIHCGSLVLLQSAGWALWGEKKAATNVSVPLRNLFVFTKTCLSHAGLRLVSSEHTYRCLARLLSCYCHRVYYILMHLHKNLKLIMY